MTEKATFAAGCFWGVEAAFRRVEGVARTQVGYTGGETENPTYEDVCGHGTRHAEAVEVEFDPERVSYDRLLDVFWAEHDPTQVDRQGWDVGDQYRSAIFVHSREQEDAAVASREREQPRRRKPIATEITPASTFWPAEDYHQRYLEKRGRATCAVGVADTEDAQPTVVQRLLGRR
jgi:peptide-methionine (S)-S-oxide reductase